MADSGPSEGAMEINLHPLVVMSVADHFTRSFVQGGSSRVVGALFGEQHGREVHVTECIDMAWKEGEEGATPVPDVEKFKVDLRLFNEVYATYELLGWYSTGAQPYEGDEAIHKLMTDFNERPLYMLLDPEVADDAKELPIACFEQQVHVEEGKTTTTFVNTKFRVTSDEAERTTVVHCAEVLHDDGTASKVGPYYNSAAKAITQLNGRLRVIERFLQDVKAGKIVPEQRLLRQIKGLCNRLPTMDSPEFREEFMAEYNDTLLVAYLAAMTKGSAKASSVVSKINLAENPKKDVMRRGGGARGNSSSSRKGMMGMAGMMRGVMDFSTRMF